MSKVKWGSRPEGPENTIRIHFLLDKVRVLSYYSQLGPMVFGVPPEGGADFPGARFFVWAHPL
ncbi:MAG: hypothetical protein V1800_10275 [Candidatus Latescibacterota bacterium]